MEVRVELLSHRRELDNAETLQAAIHNMRGHVHALLNLMELLLEDLDIFDFVNLDLFDVVSGEL